MPAILFENWARLDATQRRIGLERSWTMAEWPTRAADPEMWCGAFRFAVPDDRFFLHGEDIALKSELNLERKLLYRGCVEGFEWGMSWTDDLDLATWFSKRFDHYGEPALCSAMVPVDFILAHFDEGRKESEWVIDIHRINKLVTRKPEEFIIATQDKDGEFRARV